MVELNRKLFLASTNEDVSSSTSSSREEELGAIIVEELKRAERVQMFTEEGDDIIGVMGRARVVLRVLVPVAVEEDVVGENEEIAATDEPSAE